MYADPLNRTGQYRVKRIVETIRKGPVTETPTDINQLRRLLQPASRTPLPIRIQGAGTACNPCNLSETGTTIRMTVLARAREIHIMRLVGATDGFIRRPFLLDGAMKGALA